KKDTFEQTGWDARVEFLNFKGYHDFDKSEVFNVLAETKIALTPSIVESFGLASLEAIGLGLPLIASYRSGFRYELKRLVKDIPEASIEWLEASDFDDLPSSLRLHLRQMLRRYDGYKRGAIVLAENILAYWPTWQDSCRKMLGDVSGFRMA